MLRGAHPAEVSGKWQQAEYFLEVLLARMRAALAMRFAPTSRLDVDRLAVVEPARLETVDFREVYWTSAPPLS